MHFPLEKANASFKGAQYDGAGSSARIVGDVNGDGLADILIGAPGIYNSKPTNVGLAYLYFGKNSGWTSDTDPSKADVIFKGENQGDLAGWSLAAAGDVNGDGLADMLIGAPFNNEGGSGSGKVYLVLGRTAGWKHEMDLKSSSASFLGEGNNAGFYLDGAGDVNGDHLDDILIYAASVSNDFSPKAYLILGKKDGWKTGVSLSKANTIITGLGYCHFPVAGVGDVNGDGFDDLLLLGSKEKLYLMFGAASGWSGEKNISGSGASFILEYGQEQCPAVFKVGDVNGDGLNDLLMSSPLYNTDPDHNQSQTKGKVYLVFGKKTGWTMDLNLSRADASFVGEPGDYLGWVHSGGGDVNGDGLDDFGIMARAMYGSSPDPSKRTETYLILGNRTGWAKDIPIEKAATASYVMEDNRTYTKTLSISLAGDTNGDGRDDLLISDGAGCEGYSDRSSCPGETYLVFPSIGKPNNPPVVEPVGPQDVSEGEHLFLRINATDVDRDPLTYSLQDAPSGAHFVDGIFEYTPVASDYRPDPYNMKVIVSDGKSSSQISIKLTLHFELMGLVAGPVLSSEGTPLEGAQVIMTIKGTPFTNFTGADGLAHFTVPKSLNGTKVDINISKEGYNKKAFQAKVDQNKGVVPTTGEYPKLTKKAETKVISNLWPIELLALIMIVLSIVVMFRRSHRKR